VRTLPFKTVLSGILESLNFTFSTASEAYKTQVTGHINAALDMAYPWLDDGWPELRKATSETVTSQVISLDTMSSSLYGVTRVLSVSKNHPWKSSLPEFRDFQISDDGITVDDTVTDATLYVAHIEAPPIYNQIEWVTAPAYAAGDVRLYGSDCYRCATAHPSGTFATDLAAVKWLVLPFPAFLHIPVRTAVVAAMQDSEGYTGRASALRGLMEKYLGDVALRYDGSRYGLGAGSQR